MDTPQPPVQSEIQVPPGQKKSSLPIVLIILFFCAIVITGAAYFLVSTKKPVKAPVPSSTKPVTSEETQWKQYTESKNTYSFAYPDTWTLTESPSGDGAFELRYNGSEKSGVIEGKLLSKTEADASTVCKDLVPGKVICHLYQLSQTSKARWEITLEDNQPNQERALIARSTKPSLLFTTTQQNFDSHQTLAIMLATLKLIGEKRTYLLQICPDSWSSDKKSVVYHSVTFAAEDLDQGYVTTSCKK